MAGDSIYAGSHTVDILVDGVCMTLHDSQPAVVLVHRILRGCGDTLLRSFTGGILASSVSGKFSNLVTLVHRSVHNVVIAFFKIIHLRFRQFPAILTYGFSHIVIPVL